MSNPKIKTLTFSNEQGENVVYDLAPQWDNIVDNFQAGPHDADALYDGKIYSVQNGQNVPSETQCGVVLGIPYNNLSGNTIPDFGAQIYIPNGDDTETPNSMFYRTSQREEWNDWQEVSTVGHGHSTITAVEATTSNGLDYEVDIPGITGLADGVSFVMAVNAPNNEGAVTLNVNGLGKKQFNRYAYRSNGPTILFGNLPSSYLNSMGGFYHVTYNGAGWSITNHTVPTLAALGVTATAAELNYCDGVTSNIQTQLDALLERIEQLERFHTVNGGEHLPY